MSNNFDPTNQQKLMELVVGQVLKKHKVSTKDINLSKKEKKKIKEIVGDIESEVQRFLDNQNKQLTERDFSNNQTNEVQSDPTPSAQSAPPTQKKRPTYHSTNDIKSVKTFFNKYRD
ncbi:hypothetical protein [Alkalihalobacterium elongatum]|uniref:hypothetical protein n=1 Tax=Alkalihalobacterium elongatum TaxID=2675466 RepID=UPI001C1FCD26|nr:hypothetical protein [Alkalihalobacterium elongatum]